LIRQSGNHPISEYRGPQNLHSLSGQTTNADPLFPTVAGAKHVVLSGFYSKTIIVFIPFIIRNTGS
jgi:hypothetical protein